MKCLMIQLYVGMTSCATLWKLAHPSL